MKPLRLKGMAWRDALDMWVPFMRGNTCEMMQTEKIPIRWKESMRIGGIPCRCRRGLAVVFQEV